MGADSTIAVTPGSGATLRTYAPSSGGVVQYTRELSSSSVTHGSWTLSTTASTSQIAADVQRVCVLMVNNGNSNVYLRFDATAPTTSVHHWYLAPGDRWELPELLCPLAISVIAGGAGGTLYYVLGTIA